MDVRLVAFRAPTVAILVTFFLVAPSLARAQVQPLCTVDCGGGSPVQVTPQGTYTDTMLVTDRASTVGFTVKNIGSYPDTYTLTAGCSACTVVSQSKTSVSLSPGISTSVTVTISPGAVNTIGSVTLRAADAGCTSEPVNGPAPSGPATGEAEAAASCYASTGWWNVVNVAGTAPVVSLAPYSAGYGLAADGVTYAHVLPAVGSMGVPRTLTLAYNSTAARPVSLVTVDVSNVRSPYPTTYQLQVQLASSGVYLQLMNGATWVYYTSGTTTTTRMVAAIDAKANALATGSYPVNVVVTANYEGGLRGTTVSSRILVNDQTASSFGAGAGVAGIPRLFSIPGSYGLLLIDGSGGMSYFDRTCATCAFVPPAGESGKLATYSDPVLGALYRLTALDGSIADFRTDGRLIRHFVLPSIQDLTFGWTDTLLTSVTDAAGKAFTLSYTSGKLTRITDPAGRFTAVSIVNGRVVKLIEPGSPANGPGDSLNYDANSMLTQLNSRAGGIWTYTYNVLNQLSSITGPAAIDYTGASVRPTVSFATQDVIVWQPGTAGTSAAAPKANVKPDTLMGSTTDALGNVTKVALDRFGVATKVVDAIGQVTTITRDTLGNATRIEAPNGHTVSRSYNGYLLTAESDLTTGASHTYTYDANNRLQKSTGPVQLDYYYHDGTQGPAGTLRMVYAGNTASPGYGPWGGTIVSRHFPNAYGQDTLVIDGGDHRTRAVYATAAAGGNPLKFTDAEGHVTSYHYNAYGLVDTTALVTGAKRAVAYDIMNRPTVSVNELGYATQYSYNLLGLTRIQDPKGQVYKFGLNAWGLTVARHDLGDTTKVDSLKYDVGGNVRQVITRRGDTITLTYDALGRVVTRSGPDFPQESFSYGLNGAWTVAANANGRDSIAFDQAGRPTFASQRMPDGTTTYQMSYTYDAYSRLISRSAPTGGNVARWVYGSNLSTLDTLCGAGTCAAFARDSETKPLTITYSPGQGGSWSHIQSFDSLHAVTRDSFNIDQLDTDFGSAWDYDSLARLVFQRRSSAFLPRRYSYDAAGQLLNACTGWGTSFFPCTNEYNGTGNAYRSDPAGNRTDSLANVLIGPGNRVQRFKGYGLSYDPSGGLLAKAGLGSSDSWNKTDTTTFQWNAQGQLTRVEKWSAGGAHSVTTFAYDALGRRVVKTVNVVTTWFVYDGAQLAMDVDASSRATIAEYGFFPDMNNLFAMRTASWTGVAIKDPVIHSVVGLAAAQGGTEIKRCPLPTSPWGEIPSDTGTVVRFRMGGQEYDQETRLYHLGARYYDPQLGRFLSEDPIGIAGGLNLYAYAGNDPVNARDPSGTVVILDPVTVSGDGDSWYAGLMGLSSGDRGGSLGGLRGAGGRGGFGGAGGRGGEGGNGANATAPSGICAQATYAGTIYIDASIAAQAASFINQAVIDGAPVQRNSSFRNWWDQAYTWATHSVMRSMGLPANPANLPGASAHAGFAIDIQWNGVSVYGQNAILQAAHDFGFRQTNPRDDPVHFEYVGAPIAAANAANGFTQRQGVQSCGP